MLLVMLKHLQMMYHLIRTVKVKHLVHMEYLLKLKVLIHLTFVDVEKLKKGERTLSIDDAGSGILKGMDGATDMFNKSKKL